MPENIHDIAPVLLTPDGRYIIVRGRLWRAANPGLDPAVRQALVERLMDARRAIGTATRSGNVETLRFARSAVDAVKHELGERGPTWWNDGSPDLNRHMVVKTGYADWFHGIEEQSMNIAVSTDEGDRS